MAIVNAPTGCQVRAKQTPELSGTPDDWAAWSRRKERKARSPLSPLLLSLYRVRRLRSLCLRVARRLEGGEFFSYTIRECLRRYHSVDVGAYSFNGCLDPGVLPPGTTVGRYCSISRFIRVHRRNHPFEWLSQHPFFYNTYVGPLNQDTIRTVTDNPLMIGHDVWIGDGVIILPNCRRIGNCAVIGSGAVVTRDVPDFAIVVGNPAKLLRYRFPQKTQQLILASRWWERSIEELCQFMPSMIVALGDSPSQHPLLDSVASSANA